jgi:hypothetical protein
MDCPAAAATEGTAREVLASVVMGESAETSLVGDGWGRSDAGESRTKIHAPAAAMAAAVITAMALERPLDPAGAAMMWLD